MNERCVRARSTSPRWPPWMRTCPTRPRRRAAAGRAERPPRGGGARRPLGHARGAGRAPGAGGAARPWPRRWAATAGGGRASTGSARRPAPRTAAPLPCRCRRPGRGGRRRRGRRRPRASRAARAHRQPGRPRRRRDRRRSAPSTSALSPIPTVGSRLPARRRCPTPRAGAAGRPPRGSRRASRGAARARHGHARRPGRRHRRSRAAGRPGAPCSRTAWIGRLPAVSRTASGPPAAGIPGAWDRVPPGRELHEGGRSGDHRRGPRPDHHRVGPGRLHGGGLRGPREAAAAGLRGHAVRRRPDDHHRGGELPRLPRRHHGPRAHGRDAQAGRAFGAELRTRGRRARST